MGKIGENLLEDAGKKGIAKAIDLLVDKYIVPKIEEIVNSPKDILTLEDLFKIYLDKRYNIDKYINTIVFHNENKIIDELYIPLTIVHNNKRDKIVLNKSLIHLLNI